MIPSDVEAQKVAPIIIDVYDLGLILTEGETSGCQPFSDSNLDFLRLPPTVTECDQVIGLCGLPGYVELRDGCVGVPWAPFETLDITR